MSAKETAKEDAREAGRTAEQGARKAADNPALEWLGRGGWIVKGLICLAAARWMRMPGASR